MPTNLIPTMTSDTTPSGVASSSSFFEAATDAWNAFNSGAAYGWLDNGTGFPAFLQYQFATAQVITEYQISPWIVDNFPARAPYSWTFQGSNDGSTWTTLDTQTAVTSWTSGGFNSYTFTNSTAYLYYRLHITANNGNAYNGIKQLTMLGVTPEPISTGQANQSAHAAANVRITFTATAKQSDQSANASAKEVFSGHASAGQSDQHISISANLSFGAVAATKQGDETSHSAISSTLLLSAATHQAQSANASVRVANPVSVHVSTGQTDQKAVAKIIPHIAASVSTRQSDQSASASSILSFYVPGTFALRPRTTSEMPFVAKQVVMEKMAPRGDLT